MTLELLTQKAEDFARLAPLFQNLATSRRGLLVAPFIAALPANSSAIQRKRSPQMKRKLRCPTSSNGSTRYPARQRSQLRRCRVFGATDKPGPYVVLIKWHPGYMSAPHTYVTDRLCFVISGTWWVNSGENFEPELTVRVPAGGFVRRVAHTPHYDGVKKGGKEAAVIGIFGQAPS